MKAFQYLLVCALVFVSAAHANETELNAEIEALKNDVVELNRELFELEEQLLYPATTTFAVFVSMEAVNDFRIESVKLTLDEQDVTSHLYSEDQVEALRRGGIQKLYTGNLKPGLHNLRAEVQGQDSDGRPMKKVLVADFGKARSNKYLELKISRNTQQNKPDFAIVEWK
ncbi:AraC family transcriptional regulator [Bermanella sp. R86510]|uniref:AraC family transcriptional regulator n=1 Tax=unclassified Bermanella TaxID=2627862 RepID=UPI0037C6DFF5